ncbi:MAG TPA: hypothetical protein VKW04_17550 [Planctomycetota bacterium]|nr:hypothetical protein [Planctomycetota bacterium]
MNGLIEAMLLLGLAAGPDDAADPRPDGVRAEALADLERRIGEVGEVGESPEAPQQEDQTPHRPDTTVPPVEGSGTPLLDFDWLELHLRAGMALFSKDYHINPSPAFVLEGRAPMPWLSPSSNPDGDYFGAFAELAFASIKRTIQPQVAKPSGAMMSLAAGVDYTFFRNTTWLILLRAGFEYTTYGGVTDLKDGIGPMVGLTAGWQLTRSVSITVSPEYILGGSGSSTIVGTVGVGIDF